mmetsp:Transcript_965/g.1519  ORF Transcript_965/g.1519 Transcript_965/m.1519 type:complete len:105 (+) Transcript_965:95-409(+)
MMSEEESKNNTNNQEGGGQSNKRKAEELTTHTHQEQRQIKIEDKEEETEYEYHNVLMYHHAAATPDMDIHQMNKIQFSPGWVSEEQVKIKKEAKSVENGDYWHF